MRSDRGENLLPRGLGDSSRDAAKFELTHLRDRPRQLLAAMQLIADHPDEALGRIHLHGNPRIGVEHRRRDPAETDTFERTAPQRQPFAARAALLRGVLKTRLENLAVTKTTHPKQQTNEPVI